MLKLSLGQLFVWVRRRDVSEPIALQDMAAYHSAHCMWWKEKGAGRLTSCPVNPLVLERFQACWGQSTAPELAYKPQPGDEHTWWQRDSIPRAYCRCYQAQPPRLGAKLGRRCFIAFARYSATHARDTSIIVQLSKVSASSELKLREEYPARDCHRQPRRLKF